MKPIRKALTAAAFAGAGALGTVLLDGNLTTGECLWAAGTALLTGAATWRIPNARRTVQLEPAPVTRGRHSA